MHTRKEVYRNNWNVKCCACSAVYVDHRRRVGKCLHCKSPAILAGRASPEDIVAGGIYRYIATRREDAAMVPNPADISLCLIDVGFDLRTRGVVVEVPSGSTATSVAYTLDGQRRVARGSRAELRAELEAAGFTLRFLDDKESCK